MKSLYILHGWTYSTDKWQALVAQLTAAGFEPVQLEIPGLTAQSRQVWDIDKYVEWLNNETIAQKTPLILLGHSNGGRIAMAFALKYPNRVQKLVLIDSAGIYHDDIAIRLKRALFGLAASIGKRLTTSPAARKLLYKAARSRDYHDAPPNMRATMANLLVADKNLKIGQIQIPTTIIWGDQDKVTPLGDGQKLHSLISGSRLQIVSGARHAPFHTHPDQVAEIIKGALK